MFRTGAGDGVALRVAPDAVGTPFGGGAVGLAAFLVGCADIVWTRVAPQPQKNKWAPHKNEGEGESDGGEKSIVRNALHGCMSRTLHLKQTVAKCGSLNTAATLCGEAYQ